MPERYVKLTSRITRAGAEVWALHLIVGDNKFRIGQDMWRPITAQRTMDRLVEALRTIASEAGESPCQPK